jgi:hypothetical protein
MGSFITAEQCRRLVALPAAERQRLLHAAITVATVRLVLLVLPFRWVRAQVDTRKLALRPRGEVPAGRWAWAVQVAARRIPGATCLTQALALQWLLARAGHNASIRMGVAKDGARGFEAHAWVESNGEILLGGDEPPDRFVPILALPREAP